MEKTLNMHPLNHHEKPLAQAFVRVQPLESIFPPEEGLRNGTAFPNLHQPYGGWMKMPWCE